MIAVRRGVDGAKGVDQKMSNKAEAETEGCAKRRK